MLFQVATEDNGDIQEDLSVTAELATLFRMKGL